MQRCYLSQHGLALSKEEDSSRPLSGQGREDIARVAGFLSLFTRPQPTTIYCSNKARALQSAAMFAEGWQTPAPVTTDELSPDADPQTMLDRLNHGSDDIMVVGHLPYLEKLASHLLLGHSNGSPICFTNGGVACLQHTPTGWHLCWQVNPTMFYPA